MLLTCPSGICDIFPSWRALGRKGNISDIPSFQANNPYITSVLICTTLLFPVCLFFFNLLLLKVAHDCKSFQSLPVRTIVRLFSGKNERKGSANVWVSWPGMSKLCSDTFGFSSMRRDKWKKGQCPKTSPGLGILDWVRLLHALCFAVDV